MLCDRSQRSLLPLEPSLAAVSLPASPEKGDEVPGKDENEISIATGLLQNWNILIKLADTKEYITKYSDKIVSIKKCKTHLKNTVTVPVSLTRYIVDKFFKFNQFSCISHQPCMSC